MSVQQIEAIKMTTSCPKTKLPLKIVWRNVIIYLIIHAATLYGIYLMVFEAKLATGIWAFILYQLSILGITGGYHRLWCHRAFKARLPLRIFLAFCSSMALQNSIFVWVRDHRLHHKFSDTDADPHNANRGFFFSHIGWLLVRKHPDVTEKGNLIDTSDLLKDPVVRIQKKYYLRIAIPLCFIMPMLSAHYLLGETCWNAFFVCGVLKYTVSLHCTWLVNSAAHYWGNKPYDKAIRPSENIAASMLTLGEGYHNYHHSFPWDYSTSEWGTKFNLTTFLINTWAKLGLAYDLKSASKEVVNSKRAAKGDGSKLWFQQPHE